LFTGRTGEVLRPAWNSTDLRAGTSAPGCTSPLPGGNRRLTGTAGTVRASTLTLHVDL